MLDLEGDSTTPTHSAPSEASSNKSSLSGIDELLDMGGSVRPTNIDPLADLLGTGISSPPISPPVTR